VDRLDDRLAIGIGVISNVPGVAVIDCAMAATFTVSVTKEPRMAAVMTVFMTTPGLATITSTGGPEIHGPTSTLGVVCYG
jgi:hypothetical protein